MKITKGKELNLKYAEAVVVPVFEKKNMTPVLAGYPEAKFFVEKFKFDGKLTALDISFYSTELQKLVVIVGAGHGNSVGDSVKLAKKVIAKLNGHKIRKAVIHFAQEYPLKKSYWHNFIDYLFINDYRFDAYLKGGKEKQRISKLNIYPGLPGQLTRSLIKEREAVSLSVERVRSLVNEPPSRANPDHIVEEFERTAQSYNLEIEVLRRGNLKRHGFVGIAAVGEASPYEPALIRLSYIPADGYTKTAALVGKGITFDSGGLSLKTAASMQEMKSDMAGAAAVLGVVEAVSKLQLPVRIDAFAAVAENMPGQYAYKPGDILVFNNGKSVEILNTDAEGRLLLADALIMATRKKPDLIVELSTLTGSVAHALGDGMAAVMSRNEKLTAGLLKAGQNTGELLCRLPLLEDYRESIKSKAADLKNNNYGTAHGIKAGLFLSEFTEGIPFAHIDIAGTAFLSKPNACYLKEGATGFGVRLLLDFLKTL